MSIELIFHIGAGKTGTSSIQAALHEQKEKLQQAGFLSLGLMFEDCPVQLFPWQTAQGPGEFLRLPHANAERDFAQLLAQTIHWAENNNIKTLIWSSESFFDRFTPVVAPLQNFVANGGSLKILAYVRNHASWARSAYLQWGIKHKTYRGKIKPFNKWYESRKDGFTKTISTYEKNFPGCVSVRNYDAVQDVVHDFYKFCGLPSLSPQKLRINETPDNTETVLRALYNDSIPDPVLPIEFERLMTRVPSGIRSGQSYLHWLMPTQEDLETVRATSQDDRQKINEILTQQGEPPLADESIKTKDLKVDSDNLAFNLAKILMAQSHRINALEKSIKELEDAALPSSFSKPPSA